METQDSSLKHLKERSRKHQLAQLSINTVKEHLLPITVSEGNIFFFFLVVFPVDCCARQRSMVGITGFQVTWSYLHTTEKIKTSPHA